MSWRRIRRRRRGRRRYFVLIRRRGRLSRLQEPILRPNQILQERPDAQPDVRKKHEDRLTPDDLLDSLLDLEELRGLAEVCEQHLCPQRPHLRLQDVCYGAADFRGVGVCQRKEIVWFLREGGRRALAFCALSLFDGLEPCFD